MTPSRVLFATPRRRISSLVLGLALTLMSTAPPASAEAAGNLRWRTDHDEVLKAARAKEKPIVLDMWAPWCVPCKELEKKTLADPRVALALEGFVLGKINMDAPENEALWERYKTDNLPRIFFLRPDGSPIAEVTLKEFEGADLFLARVARAKQLLGGARSKTQREETPKDAPTLAPNHGAAPEGSRSEQKHVTAQLIADTAQISPGSEVRVGVHFKLDPGWHIYWHYSGQAGLPTKLNWDLPKGVEAGPLQWPAPAQFEEKMDEDTLTTIGYEKELFLFSTVKIPADFPARQALEIEARAQWLVCRESCIRGKALLKLSIPSGETSLKSTNAALIEQWAAQVPQDARDAAPFTSSSTVSNPTLSEGQTVQVSFAVEAPAGMKLRPPSGKYKVIFVPKTPRDLEVLNLRAAVQGQRVHSEYTLRGREGLPESGSARVGGVFQLLADGEPVALRVERQINYGKKEAATAALAAPGAGPISAGSVAEAEVVEASDSTSVSLWQMLLFALIGGLLLNIMPCVLPVLSIKIIGIVQQAGEDRKTIWRHGLAYGAGVVMSFWVLAIFVIVLKASGDLVGWGFQFQNPWFVVALCTIIFAFALNLLGVFEVFVLLPGKLAGAGGEGGSGLRGSFANGAFATLLATPCTAPFLGASMGFALSQSGPVIFLFFTVVGIGLASPFLLLAAKPAWKDKLPRPGPWMDHFKQVMGFVLIATALWLVDVLTAQVSIGSVMGFLAFLATLGFAAWLYGNFATLASSPKQRRLSSALAVASLLLAGYWGLEMEPIERAQGAEATTEKAGITWINFSPETIASLQKGGQSVFIDFTAEWCLTCKVNENTVIYSEEVTRVFKELHIATVKADFTNSNKVIAAWLRRFKRAGVPLYVILPPANRPDQKVIVLPEILTKDLLIEKLKSAAR